MGRREGGGVFMLPGVAKEPQSNVPGQEVRKREQLIRCVYCQSRTNIQANGQPERSNPKRNAFQQFIPTYPYTNTNRQQLICPQKIYQTVYPPSTT